jgi:hypothetical protein
MIKQNFKHICSQENLSSFSPGIRLFRGNNELPLGKGPSSLKGSSLLFESLSNHSHLIVVLYKVVTYRWKGFKDSYNFVVGNISIKIHMQKLCSHTKFQTQLFPREYLPRGIWLFLKGTTMFPKKQFDSKLCVNITFACEFWLKCFRLQSCNSFRHLSNDRSQAYIKLTMNVFLLNTTLYFTMIVSSLMQRLIVVSV